MLSFPPESNIAFGQSLIFVLWFQSNDHRCEDGTEQRNLPLATASLLPGMALGVSEYCFGCRDYLQDPSRGHRVFRHRQSLVPPPLSAKAAGMWWVALMAALVWVYWPSLVLLTKRWSQDPQYTHGYVVPLFAALVLWLRRDRFPGPTRSSLGLWGLAWLLVAAVGRIAGNLFSFEWLEIGSLLPATIGVVWLAFGRRTVLWAWPAFALMMFILPWPWQVDLWLTHPLRRVATVCSTFALQTIGVPALSRGNVIIVGNMEVGVIEACSGLGMLMTFFALSTAVAFAVERPRLDKCVIFLSAVPIALLMNVIRITVTVFLFQYADAETARVVFHDVAGWVMMPMALGALGGLIALLNHLWIVEEPRPVPIVRSRPSAFAATGGSQPALERIPVTSGGPTTPPAPAQEAWSHRSEAKSRSSASDVEPSMQEIRDGS
jgi:exosortase